MNTKRFALSCVGTLAFLFVSDMVIHGHLLMSYYTATAHLWRSEQSMHEFMKWMIAAQVLFSIAFVYIFLLGYEKKGVKEGLRYGGYMALLFATHTLGMYAYMPVPLGLIVGWMIAYFVQLMGAGAVVAMIYKPGKR